MKISSVFCQIFLILAKILLACIALFVLVFGAYLVAIIDVRIAVGLLCFSVFIVVGTICWCLPKSLRRRAYVVASSVGIAIVIGFMAVCGVYVYEQAITIRDRSIRSADYYPFSENSKAARLEGASSLQFTASNAPRLVAYSDYNLISAYVTATYPEGVFGGGNNSYLTEYSNPGVVYESHSYDIYFDRMSTFVRYYKDELENDAVSFTTIARDALVFYTHKSNPVKNLTTEQLLGICTGKITNWKEVGGEDRKIELYTKHSRTTWVDVLEQYLGVKLSGYQQKLNFVFPYIYIDYREVEYRNTRGALGFTFMSCMDDRYKNTHAIAIDGVSADKNTVADGSYPLYTDIVAMTRAEREENVNDFIDWILSDEGRRLTNLSGFACVN